MYAVTDDFKASIYGSARSISGRVTFDISPTDLDTDPPTVTATSEFFVSQASSQIVNNTRQATFKLVTWEQDRVILDGSFNFPDDSSANWKETGWVSSLIANASGTFSTSQSVTLTYANNHTSAGVTITFDPLFGEYAADFSVTVFNSSNAVIYTTTVTNNTLTQYKLITTLAAFRKITVTVTKWSVGNRRARIAEIDAGVVLVYTGENLIRLNLSEEIDPISSSLVIPEFEFSVDNSNNEFSISNPSGIYASLQQRQRIFPELGLVLNGRTEWVPLGLFYLYEWQSDYGSLTATFRGRSKIDLLDLATYSQSTPQVGYNLFTMATQVLAAAGVTGYSIDTALSSISTNGLLQSMTCREALQMIAIAAQATIRITRDDVLKIETTRSSTQSDYISFDEMYTEPQIQQSKEVQSVSVSYFTSLGAAAGVSTATVAGVQNGEVISVSSNTLINSSTQATAVANWILSRRQERYLFKITSRGNPALELYDYLKIDNVFNANQFMRLTKNELRYEGYLESVIEGRTS